MLERGEIWLADLNPRHGTEPGKTRPVLIVQAQALLTAGHPSTLVIPLTSRLVKDAEPLRIRVTDEAGVSRASDLLVINSVRSTTGAWSSAWGGSSPSCWRQSGRPFGRFSI